MTLQTADEGDAKTHFAVDLLQQELDGGRGIGCRQLFCCTSVQLWAFWPAANGMQWVRLCVGNLHDLPLEMRINMRFKSLSEAGCLVEVCGEASPFKTFSHIHPHNRPASCVRSCPPRLPPSMPFMLFTLFTHGKIPLASKSTLFILKTAGFACISRNALSEGFHAPSW